MTTPDQREAPPAYTSQTDAGGGIPRWIPPAVVGILGILYFDYTFCPDIFPTTLADMTRVRGELGTAADDVHFVFVSVDPQRDTPAVLNTYINNFDPAFLALQADMVALRPLTAAYNLVVNRVEDSGSSVSYLRDHSARTDLIDPPGNLHTVYAYGTPADMMRADPHAMLDTSGT